jgi:hypothetical protein
VHQKPNCYVSCFLRNDKNKHFRQRHLLHTHTMEARHLYKCVMVPRNTTNNINCTPKTGATQKHCAILGKYLAIICCGGNNGEFFAYLLLTDAASTATKCVSGLWITHTPTHTSRCTKCDAISATALCIYISQPSHTLHTSLKSQLHTQYTYAL